MGIYLFCSQMISRFKKREVILRFLHLFLATTYPGMTKDLNHLTLLEELIFWTVIYRFPQKMVTFLLNMLPENDYKVRSASCT